MRGEVHANVRAHRLDMRALALLRLKVCCEPQADFTHGGTNTGHDARVGHHLAKLGFGLRPCEAVVGSLLTRRSELAIDEPAARAPPPAVIGTVLGVDVSAAVCPPHRVSVFA